MKLIINKVSSCANYSLFIFYLFSLLIDGISGNICKDTSPSCARVLNAGHCSNALYNRICCQTCSNKNSSPTTGIASVIGNEDKVDEEKCTDVHKDCSVVLKLDVCSNYYYRRHCCKTCLNAGKITKPLPGPPGSRIPVVVPTPDDSSFDPVPNCGRRSEIPTFFQPGTSLLNERVAFENKIFGGREADKNSWPWMALLGEFENNRADWLCGGALINDKWILTAAHCLLRNIQIVRLGEHDLKKIDSDLPEQDFRVETKLWYPGYQGNHNYHDIGLVKIVITGPLPSRFVPVCLPWRQELQQNHIGKTAIVAGWGARSFLGRMSTVLREVEIDIFDGKRCIDAYAKHPLDYRRKWPRGMKKEEILCAGHELGEGDSCQGDSGGPLVVADHIRYTAIGVVSVGFGCGDKDYPGIYAATFYSPYLQWIKNEAFK